MLQYCNYLEWAKREIAQILRDCIRRRNSKVKIKTEIYNILNLFGGVTVIVQEFQFGMNWSEYFGFVGDISGYMDIWLVAIGSNIFRIFARPAKKNLKYFALKFDLHNELMFIILIQLIEHMFILRSIYARAIS
jgi:hypothetical protein